MIFKFKSGTLVHEKDIDLIHKYNPGLPRTILNEIVNQQGYVSGEVDNRYLQYFKNKNSLEFLDKCTYLINYNDVKTLMPNQLDDLIVDYYAKLGFYNESLIFKYNSSYDYKRTITLHQIDDLEYYKENKEMIDNIFKELSDGEATIDQFLEVYNKDLIEQLNTLHLVRKANKKDNK